MYISLAGKQLLPEMESMWNSVTYRNYLLNDLFTSQTHYRIIETQSDRHIQGSSEPAQLKLRSTFSRSTLSSTKHSISLGARHGYEALNCSSLRLGIGQTRLKNISMVTLLPLGSTEYAWNGVQT